MATDSWGAITLTSVLAAGNLTQLYPSWVSAGVAKAGSTAGQLIRRPLQGQLFSFQVMPINANSAGYLEIWDIDGGEGGADVSSATAITNAQALALVALGKAKLMFRQRIPGSANSGVLKDESIFRSFMKGLAVRYVADAGVGETAELNVVAQGGYQKVESRGTY